MKCPNCGNEVNDAARFCVECGLPILDAPEGAEPIAAAAEAPDLAEKAVFATEAVEQTPAVDLPVDGAAEAAVAATVSQESEAAAEAIAPEAATPVFSEAAAKEPQKAEPEAPVTVTVQTQTDPRMLLTTAQYFFLTILFHLPVIGLVFLFVWGCGKPKNISLKRYSLAMLTLRLIGYFLLLAGTVAFLLGLSGLIPGFSIEFVSPFAVRW